jgi:hypothetical protein
MLLQATTTGCNPAVQQTIANGLQGFVISLITAGFQSLANQGGTGTTGALTGTGGTTTGTLPGTTT